MQYPSQNQPNTSSNHPLSIAMKPRNSSRYTFEERVKKIRKERSGDCTKTTESFEAYLSDFDADFKLKWKRIGRRRLKIKKINSVESNALLRPAYL
mmetsp:Transcript_24993/g.51607  ORF Transcript_24993/g.51607 Transcript_24993/m.51607 type:complete len:96 (+) Transcript_24993:1980-2267(+)